jgi:hypothetical protein
MTALLGIYRAVVVSSDDPIRKRRLLVEAPAVLNAGPMWAEACVPYRSRAIPPVGATVWLLFEGGDVNDPVWVGTRP